jgi:hypothetical protein
MDEDSDEQDNSEDDDNNDNNPPPCNNKFLFTVISPLSNADVYTGANSEHILQVRHSKYLVRSPFTSCLSNYTSHTVHLRIHVPH